MRTKIRNRNNQAQHLTLDTNGKVTTSRLDITSESQEVSPFPAGHRKASINRRAQKHNTYKTEIMLLFLSSVDWCVTLAFLVIFIVLLELRPIKDSRRLKTVEEY